MAPVGWSPCPSHPLPLTPLNPHPSSLTRHNWYRYAAANTSSEDGAAFLMRVAGHGYDVSSILGPIDTSDYQLLLKFHTQVKFLATRHSTFIDLHFARRHLDA